MTHNNEQPPNTELPPNPATCTQPLGAAACLQCVAAPHCPILQLKRASEQQVAAPNKTSYQKELLADNDSFVIAGYEERNVPPKPAPPPKPQLIKKTAPRPATPIIPARRKLERSLAAQFLANTEALALQSLARKMTRR